MANTAEARNRRAMLAQEAATLRGLGFLYREIAEALEISRSYASELLDDPGGEKARERKKGYAGECIDCGGPTSGSEGRKEEPRCRRCAPKVAGRKRTVWTAARLIARIQEWDDLHGEPPAITDWFPWQARNVLRDESRARRFEDAFGYWPHFTCVVRRFGSWSEGLRAVGFEPRAPNGGGGNMLRTRAHRAKAAP